MPVQVATHQGNETVTAESLYTAAQEFVPEIRRRALRTLDWGADVHPVLRRVYAARGIARAEEIDDEFRGWIRDAYLVGEQKHLRDSC